MRQGWDVEEAEEEENHTEMLSHNVRRQLYLKKKRAFLKEKSEALLLNRLKVFQWAVGDTSGLHPGFNSSAGFHTVFPLNRAFRLSLVWSPWLTQSLIVLCGTDP